jgi:hypothetical protein
MYVTPLKDQTENFSNNYVGKFLADSPIRDLLVGPDSKTAVLQKTFRNSSRITFAYSFGDPMRTRSRSTDLLLGDETQNLIRDDFAVISESLSHSPYELKTFAGTALTLDTMLEYEWRDSSMGEWIIKCPACNFFNIPATQKEDGHIEKMIGPYRDDISEDAPGIVCAKCARPVSPRTGRWIHRREDIVEKKCGLHIPQILMPLHYAKPEKWMALLNKQQSIGAGQFYNEVLGIAWDSAMKLLSLDDLRKAAMLPENNDESIHRIGNYSLRILGVDWGGGGAEGVSLTALAVVGVRPDGKLELIYGKRLLTPHDHPAEAMECLKVFKDFQCSYLAHDFGGAGDLRETFMLQAGLPHEVIIPICYGGVVGGLPIRYIAPEGYRVRPYWMVDKSRTLQLTCYALKLGGLRTFAYDYIAPERPGLLNDFLSLVERKVPRANGTDAYAIHTLPKQQDDFAQAVNIACVAAWNSAGSWPDFLSLIRDNQTS